MSGQLLPGWGIFSRHYEDFYTGRDKKVLNAKGVNPLKPQFPGISLALRAIARRETLPVVLSPPTLYLPGTAHRRATPANHSHTYRPEPSARNVNLDRPTPGTASLPHFAHSVGELPSAMPVGTTVGIATDACSRERLTRSRLTSLTDIR